MKNEKLNLGDFDVGKKMGRSIFVPVPVANCPARIAGQMPSKGTFPASKGEVGLMSFWAVPIKYFDELRAFRHLTNSREESKDFLAFAPPIQTYHLTSAKWRLSTSPNPGTPDAPLLQVVGGQRQNLAGEGGD